MGSLEVSSSSPVAVNLYTPKSPFLAVLESKRRLGDRQSPHYCWHLVINVRGSELEGNCRPGQSLGILPHGRYADRALNGLNRNLDGKIRLYSIASPGCGDDGHGETVSLCVKRELGEDEVTGGLVLGVASNYLCDTVAGQSIPLTGPVGKSFLLPENPLEHDYVFVATGTGIAPFRGMLIELFQQGYAGEVWLVFGVPYSTDILYGDELARLAADHPNFHYVLAMSREQRNPRGGKMYVQDRLEENEGQLIDLLRRPTSALYLCGLKGMEYGIYAWLCRSGSDLIRVPPGRDWTSLHDKRRDDPEWGLVEKNRDRERLFKETY
ncbi:MAG: hypothetical protein HYU36_17300 [Planctomycetes bacterium]|nr:hypothetical protein [Planctomycetota bacterium]